MANFKNTFPLKHLILAISICLVAILFLKLRTVHVTETPPEPFFLAVTEPSDVQDSRDRVINVNLGDPTMYERYWRHMGDKIDVVISGWQFTSYVSDPNRICWFLEPELANQIVRLHQVVGNAVTEGRYLVVGTGSAQLLQAALFALVPQDASAPVSVVSASPFYTSYPLVTDSIKSGIHKWEGDARSFDKDGPYIELVTSPNNPDGFSREPVVNKSGGILLHDFAYYWPQYTPISSPADHDVMFFSVTKSTGHAGMRIGWAIVKDKEVAKKMTRYIDLTTIGVSKDSQYRAAKVLKAVSDSCEEAGRELGGGEGDRSVFGYALRQMEARWKRLREAVNQSGGQFSLPVFSPSFCNFFGKVLEPHPAFAWLRCEAVDDCEAFFRSKNILARAGTQFGYSSKYVRISMMDRDENFNLFIKRLSTLTLDSPNTAL